MTASRALLRDLQAAFWADVPERKTRKSVVMPATQLEHHEPAPKLEVLGPVKIDRRFWVSSTRGHERPRRLAVVAGARQVSRPGCDPAARGRSVRSCTGSPSPEGRPRPPRSRGSVAGPRTPPDRSDGSVRLCRSVAASGAGCTGAGCRRPRPPAQRRRRTLARGHTADAGWGNGKARRSSARKARLER